MEKCIFCEHRVKQGNFPTAWSPARQRPASSATSTKPPARPAQLLKKYKPMRLKEEKKTRPNVAYIRSFRPASVS